jgi:saccharopepsin
LFLPSSTCFSPSPRHCSPANASYNASASSTYYDNGTITQLAYGPVSGYARLSEDVLALTDELQVPGQTFHEIKYYRGWHDDMGAEYFDGVLGLSIDQPMRPFGSPNILPSPFKGMIDNHLLDANMFSIV